MKAIVCQGYGSPGDVLRFEEAPAPSVGDNEVLVRVRAASINPYDWHVVTGLPYMMRLQSGLHRPKATGPGADVAGQVEAVGKNVTLFHPGDEVFGGTDFGGTCAEYVSVSANTLALKPDNLDFEQAAAVPVAALTALQGLRDKGHIKEGHKVLINGASGGVGTFAVQIAKALGAEVTGVCSTRNVDLVRSLGANHVIDYTLEDFTRGPRRFDLMLDNVGNRAPSHCCRVLTRKGIYVASFGEPENLWLGPMAKLLRMFLLSAVVSQKMVTFVTKNNTRDLDLLRELIEGGQVTPVIDRTYPLSDVPEALSYLEEGHARGKVVITT